MTIEEMSNAFDTLANSYMHNWGFGQNDDTAFDEYEKSFYLTLAQELFVVSCYNGKNQSGYQFEVTEEDRRILDALISTRQITNQYNGNLVHIVPESVFYKVSQDSDVMFITYEQVVFSGGGECIDGQVASVVPVKQDEFWNTYNNSFRGPNARRVLRLDAGDDSNGEDIVELVSKYDIGKYVIRFLRKPEPILLVDMPEGTNLSIFGNRKNRQECKLDSISHQRIVETAVNMALQRRQIGMQK